MAENGAIAFICFCLLKQEKYSNITFSEFTLALELYEYVCVQKIINNEVVKNTTVFDDCISQFVLSDLSESQGSGTTSNASTLLDSTVSGLTRAASNLTTIGNERAVTAPMLSVGTTLYEDLPLELTFFIVFLISIYSLSAFISVIGNTLLVIVMTCGYRSSFLDISIFLINLGIFNLLMSLFCMPFTFINALFKKWIFAPFMCPITNFVQLLSVNGCIITLTFLAINRYQCVANPLSHKAKRSTSKFRKIIAGIWLVSFCFSVVQLFIYQCKSKVRADGTPIGTHCHCVEIWASERNSNYRFYAGYTVWIFLQTYLIPAVIIIIMYSKVILKLNERNNNLSDSMNLNSNAPVGSQTIKITRMLSIVIATFLLNWLPIHLFHLVIAYNYINFREIDESTKSQVTALFFLCHWLSMSNSFINPIIYCCMNNNFKNDLLSLICCEINRFNSKRKSVIKIVSDRRSTTNDHRPMSPTARMSMCSERLLRLPSSELATDQFANEKHCVTKSRHSISVVTSNHKNQYPYTIRSKQSPDSKK